MKWELAPDIQKQIVFLVKKLTFSHLCPERVFCFRSFGSKSSALARIWSLPRIWQRALNTKPAYCLEVISEKFDRLALAEQKKILVHELLHIPRNFSGTLLSHRQAKGEGFEKRVEKLFKQISKH